MYDNFQVLPHLPFLLIAVSQTWHILALYELVLIVGTCYLARHKFLHLKYQCSISLPVENDRYITCLLLYPIFQMLLYAFQFLNLHVRVVNEKMALIK